MAKRGKSSSGYAERIANLGEAWGKAKDEAGKGFVDIPPGVYNFQLIGAEITESSNDWLHVAFRFACISEGEFLGETFVHRCGLEKEESLPFLVRDLQRLGVDTEDVELSSLDDLEPVLEDLTSGAPCIRGKLVESGEFTNLRIQRLLELDDDEIPEYTVGGERASFPGGNDAEEENEADDPPASDDEIEVGDRVSADFDGDEYEGVVEKISGDKASVKFDDGDEDKFALDDLTLVAKADGEDDGEDDTAELKAGMSVAYEVRGKEVEGEVVKVDSAKEVCHVKRKGKSKPDIVALDEVEILEG